jgi:hypothetical protein
MSNKVPLVVFDDEREGCNKSKAPNVWCDRNLYKELQQRMNTAP